MYVVYICTSIYILLYLVLWHSSDSDQRDFASLLEGIFPLMSDSDVERNRQGLEFHCPSSDIY